MALVGYRNIGWLLSRLLPADMGDASDYDADVAAIGLGVAAAFDRFTGRILRRTVGAIHETSADQDAIVASCYPIETLTSVQLVAAGVVSDISSQIAGTQLRAGIVRFHGAPGDERDLIRLTITGGYWCEDDAAMPAAATPLPDDLLTAWVQQCGAVCEAENVFRAKGATPQDKKTGSGVTLENLTLLAGVKVALQTYIRFS